MRLPKLLVSLWVYFAIATTLAQAGILGVLWQRGKLTPATAENLLVVAYDVPVEDIYQKLADKSQSTKKEMVSFEEVEHARMLTTLDLDLREMSADKGLGDLRELDTRLTEERNRYTLMKDSFDQSWQQVQRGSTDTALQEVRRQIESASPKLAKDQLLRILEDPELDPDAALSQIVAIFKSMPVDKRKKIVPEFKDREMTQLHEILRQIRLGMPELSLIRETRDQLQQFKTRN